VAPDHDARPHDPVLVHLPLESTARPIGQDSIVVEAAQNEPARFVLPSGTVMTSVAGAGGTGRDSGEPIGERYVDVPARLVIAGTALYPAPAREAEVEADVPLEIVVDADGRVVDARATEKRGYGLEEAAVQSVRSYRFSPARRQGGAVCVRMRWTVQFRLR
jgi:TonB family protein